MQADEKNPKNRGWMNNSPVIGTGDTEDIDLLWEHKENRSPVKEKIAA